MLARSSNAHQLIEKRVQLCYRIGAKAGMGGRRLDDGARRRREPVKTLAEIELRNWTRGWIAGRNARNRAAAAPRSNRPASASSRGAKHSRRARSSSTRAARNRRERQTRTTPAFRNSARSTRGTIRMTAYSNASRSGTFRLLFEHRCMLQSTQQQISIGRPHLVWRAVERIVGQPDVGNLGQDAVEQLGRDLGAQLSSGRGNRARRRAAGCDPAITETGRPPRARHRSSCGENRATRRGRSTRACHARSADSDCAASGRHSG